MRPNFRIEGVKLGNEYWLNYGDVVAEQLMEMLQLEEKRKVKKHNLIYLKGPAAGEPTQRTPATDHTVKKLNQAW